MGHRRRMFPNSETDRVRALVHGDSYGMGGARGANSHYPEQQSVVSQMREMDPGTHTVMETVSYPGGSYTFPKESSKPQGKAPGLNKAYGNYGNDAANTVIDRTPRED